MQIRLFQIDREGNLEAPSRQRAWGRAVTAFVCWFLLVAWILDYLWPLGDKRHQCLHDKVARTVAVDVREAPCVRPMASAGRRRPIAYRGDGVRHETP